MENEIRVGIWEEGEPRLVLFPDPTVVLIRRPEPPVVAESPDVVEPAATVVSEAAVEPSATEVTEAVAEPTVVTPEVTVVEVSAPLQIAPPPPRKFTYEPLRAAPVAKTLSFDPRRVPGAEAVVVFKREQPIPEPTTPPPLNTLRTSVSALEEFFHHATPPPDPEPTPEPEPESAPMATVAPPEPTALVTLKAVRRDRRKTGNRSARVIQHDGSVIRFL